MTPRNTNTTATTINTTATAAAVTTVFGARFATGVAMSGSPIFRLRERVHQSRVRRGSYFFGGPKLPYPPSPFGHVQTNHPTVSGVCFMFADI